jgi:hypothetical protein
VNPVRPVRFFAGISFGDIRGKSEKMVWNAIKGGPTG